MTNDERLAIIEKSSKQVSRGIFFSTIIIVASFLPVFLLTGQEGKLFHPLAYTKTFILLIDAVLAVTLAPVLLSFFMKGKFKTEEQNPINRGLERVYAPLINWCLTWRKTTIGINLALLAISIPLLLSLGTEFMPPLDEGSILFMPITQPDVSNTEVKRILQVQDRIIKQVPEVAGVLGKAGRSIHRGRRPMSRGMVRNPVDHPNGGGQGKSKGGGGRQHLTSPWGLLAKGYRTRSKSKISNRFILVRRDGRPMKLK